MYFWRISNESVKVRRGQHLLQDMIMYHNQVKLCTHNASDTSTAVGNQIMMHFIKDLLHKPLAEPKG